MKLLDLEPEWWQGGPGIRFLCPCCRAARVYLPLRNPIDGRAPRVAEPLWERTGEDFMTLSLAPSVRRRGGCNTHFFVTRGEIVLC